jgi:hypothetical protein
MLQRGLMQKWPRRPLNSTPWGLPLGRLRYQSWTSTRALGLENLLVIAAFKKLKYVMLGASSFSQRRPLATSVPNKS